MKFIPFLLLLCTFCSCSKTLNDSYDDNRIVVDLNNPQNSSLSDYFSHIELIPLETTDKVLIGSLKKIFFHQNRFFTLDFKQAIVQVFDEKGNFIFQIGRRGQGPGEYISLYDMIINPFTGNIDLLCAHGFIHSYDLSGNHLKTIKYANKELYAAHNFVPLNDSLYVLYSSSESFSIQYFDSKKNRVIHREYNNPRVLESLTTQPTFYEYNGKWYFSRTFDNSVYVVGTDSLVKAFSWDFGKLNYKVSKEESPLKNNYTREQPERQMVQIMTRFPYWILNQVQNNRYVMAQLLKTRKSNKISIDQTDIVYLMYDKLSQECKFVESFNENVRFYPRMITDEYILCTFPNADLAKWVPIKMLDSENKERYEKLLRETEELNPIIIKYFFK